MKLTNVDLRGILACTFPVSPGPQGANCLQNQGTGGLAGRTAGAGATGPVSADQPLELPSEP
jgi:hypothetical protein